MNIVIPMAGIGKRLRPHTLTVPKPLIPIAGKPIVERLVEDITAIIDDEVHKIGFIVGDIDDTVRGHLEGIAQKVGAEPIIIRQGEALGTGHAVHCAAELLEGEVVIAFADTLFKANFHLDRQKDGMIWVKEVDDPSAFGVVKVDNGVISEFIEKPTEPISNLAIIGIYYFKDGLALRKDLDEIIASDHRVGGEFQLTTALENLKNRGSKFGVGQVDSWLDCGNKKATVSSNTSYLQFLNGDQLISESAVLKNAEIIPPVFIGEGTQIEDSKIGPYVSIGSGCLIKGSELNESLIQNESEVRNAKLTNSMIGNFVKVMKFEGELNLGDYNEVTG